MTESEFNSSFEAAKPYPTIVMNDDRRITMVGRYFGFGAPKDGQIILMSALEDKQIRGIGGIFIEDIKAVEKMSHDQIDDLRIVIDFKKNAIMIAEREVQRLIEELKALTDET